MIFFEEIKGLPFFPKLKIRQVHKKSKFRPIDPKIALKVINRILSNFHQVIYSQKIYSFKDMRVIMSIDEQKKIYMKTLNKFCFVTYPRKIYSFQDIEETLNAG